MVISGHGGRTVHVEQDMVVKCGSLDWGLQDK